jgi:hypothetical protein
MSPRTTEQVLQAQMQQSAASKQETKMTTIIPTFNTDEEEGSKPFSLLPNGTYQAEIMLAKYGPTKNGSGMKIDFTYRVTEGEFEHRNVFQTVVIEHTNPKATELGRARLKDIAVACNVTGELTDLEKLYFQPLGIKVAVRNDPTGQYDPRNEIRTVYPVGAMATPDQVRKKQQADALKEATKVKPAFGASTEDMNDEIPFNL